MRRNKIDFEILISNSLNQEECFIDEDIKPYHKFLSKNGYEIIGISKQYILLSKNNSYYQLYRPYLPQQKQERIKEVKQINIGPIDDEFQDQDYDIEEFLFINDGMISLQQILDYLYQTKIKLSDKTIITIIKQLLEFSDAIYTYNTLVLPIYPALIFYSVNTNRFSFLSKQDYKKFYKLINIEQNTFSNVAKGLFENIILNQQQEFEKSFVTYLGMIMHCLITQQIDFNFQNQKVDSQKYDEDIKSSYLDLLQLLERMIIRFREDQQITIKELKEELQKMNNDNCLIEIYFNSYLFKYQEKLKMYVEVDSYDNYSQLKEIFQELEQINLNKISISENVIFAENQKNEKFALVVSSYSSLKLEQLQQIQTEKKFFQKLSKLFQKTNKQEERIQACIRYTDKSKEFYQMSIEIQHSIGIELTNTINNKDYYLLVFKNINQNLLQLEENKYSFQQYLSIFKYILISLMRLPNHLLRHKITPDSVFLDQHLNPFIFLIENEDAISLTDLNQRNDFLGLTEILLHLLQLSFCYDTRYKKKMVFNLKVDNNQQKIEKLHSKQERFHSDDLEKKEILKDNKTTMKTKRLFGVCCCVNIEKKQNKRRHKVQKAQNHYISYIQNNQYVEDHYQGQQNYSYQLAQELSQHKDLSIVREQIVDKDLMQKLNSNDNFPSFLEHQEEEKEDSQQVKMKKERQQIFQEQQKYQDRDKYEEQEIEQEEEKYQEQEKEQEIYIPNQENNDNLIRETMKRNENNERFQNDLRILLKLLQINDIKGSLCFVNKILSKIDGNNLIQQPQNYFSQNQEELIQFLEEIYFKDNGTCIEYLKEFIKDSDSELIKQNQQYSKFNNLIRNIQSYIWKLNGEVFEIKFSHILFIIKYTAFQNSMREQSLVGDRILKEDQAFEEKIRSGMSGNPYDNFLANNEFPLYLLKMFYKINNNINILYTNIYNSQTILNKVLEHNLFSGTIEDTCYIKLRIQDFKDFNYEKIQKNPQLMRKYLNEIGLNDFMLFNIEKGSTLPCLFHEDLYNRIENTPLITYHSFLDGQALNVEQCLNSQYNIYYNTKHQSYKQQYRGNIKINSTNGLQSEAQCHNFPIGYYGIGLNVNKYNNDEWIGSNENDGVWMTLFHGTKPIPSSENLQQDNHHIRDVIENGFWVSKNEEGIRYKDAMANRECRFHDCEKIGSGNIYFTNVIRNEYDHYRCDFGGAEVYMQPFQINKCKYQIGFMCRANPTKVYSPRSHPVQFTVKDNSFVRPYKILIMESPIVESTQVNIRKQLPNGKYSYSRFKHYLGETIQTLILKLQKSQLLTDQKNGAINVCLKNGKKINLSMVMDKEKTTIEQLFSKYVNLSEESNHIVLDYTIVIV